MWGESAGTVHRIEKKREETGVVCGLSHTSAPPHLTPIPYHTSGSPHATPWRRGVLESCLNPSSCNPPPLHLTNTEATTHHHHHHHSGAPPPPPPLTRRCYLYTGHPPPERESWRRSPAGKQRRPDPLLLPLPLPNPTP